MLRSSSSDFFFFAFWSYPSYEKCFCSAFRLSSNGTVDAAFIFVFLFSTLCFAGGAAVTCFLSLFLSCFSFGALSDRDGVSQPSLSPVSPFSVSTDRLCVAIITIIIALLLRCCFLLTISHVVVVAATSIVFVIITDHFHVVLLVYNYSLFIIIVLLLLSLPNYCPHFLSMSVVFLPWHHLIIKCIFISTNIILRSPNSHHHGCKAKPPPTLVIN